ncbi:MAG: nicotinamide riboside transporter PnuC [Novosphingobium sp.]
MGCRVLIDTAMAYAAAHWTELLGSVLGLIQIWLLVRRSIWNFPVAMAMVTLIGITLFEARLYSECGLQAFFFVVNAIGWVQWNRVTDDADTVPVSWMDNRSRALWALVTAVLSLSLGWIMHRFTNAALPFADSAVTGASIAAQLLLNGRRVENWVLWVVIDIVSIGLYLYRDLHFLAVLYVAFLIISIIGLKEWTRASRLSPSDKFA